MKRKIYFPRSPEENAIALNAPKKKRKKPVFNWLREIKRIFTAVRTGEPTEAMLKGVNQYVKRKAGNAYSVRWDGRMYEVVCNGEVHYRRETIDEVKRLCQ